MNKIRRGKDSAMLLLHRKPTGMVRTVCNNDGIRIRLTLTPVLFTRVNSRLSPTSKWAETESSREEHESVFAVTTTVSVFEPGLHLSFRPHETTTQSPQSSHQPAHFISATRNPSSTQLYEGDPELNHFNASASAKPKDFAIS
jgi:hypothetical protein